MKVAILWLINEKGEILLSQRAATMSTDAGVWGPSVSGKVDEGETPRQAAIREANEELGIDPANLGTLCHLHNSTHNHQDGKTREFFSFYANVDATLTSKMKFAPREVAAVKWISLTDLKKMYERSPETIIIASNTSLWNEIFDNLQTAITAIQ